MVVEHNLRVVYLREDVFLLSVELFKCALSLPLESGERLRYEASAAYRHFRRFLAADAAHHVVICVDDALRELCDPFEIFVGLGRQTEHEIQLDLALPRLKSGSARLEKVFLGDVLVDSVAESLRTGFRSEREPGVPDGRDLLEQFLCEAVKAHRRKRDIDLSVVCPLEQFVAELLDISVIAYRER